LTAARVPGDVAAASATGRPRQDSSPSSTSAFRVGAAGGRVGVASEATRACNRRVPRSRAQKLIPSTGTSSSVKATAATATTIRRRVSVLDSRTAWPHPA
jgi:hypothetical protein